MPITEKVKKSWEQNKDYKQRVQFILSHDNDIICHRYIRVNGLNEKLTRDLDFVKSMNYITHLIKEDLKSKSMIFEEYLRTDLPIKLSGFKEGEEEVFIKTNPNNNPELFLDSKKKILKPQYDNVSKEPFNTKYFSFMVLLDERIVYERIWDSSFYQKYIIQNYDLTNNSNQKKESFSFKDYIISKMSEGKENLINSITNIIIDSISN